MKTPAPIIILNGAPRAGKSSIVEAIQALDERPWMNLGVDTYARAATPPRYRPGIGLRPGGERPDLEELIPGLYLALYNSIATHSRLGLPVIADVCHHDGYSKPLGILRRVARVMAGLPVLFVGVRCPIETIMERRKNNKDREREYMQVTTDDVPEPIQLWQDLVHLPGIYDVEVDTSVTSPRDCAVAILRTLAGPPALPRAFDRIATSHPF